MKRTTKEEKGIDDPTLGDAWPFTAIERHSKLILAWRLGHRAYEDTVMFTEKLAWATEGSFQITTDGFAAYRDAVVLSRRSESRLRAVGQNLCGKRRT